MTTAIIQFVICATMIVFAAIVLTKYSDMFARATGLGHLLVGTVLLAGATSLPELSTNWAIVRLDLPDMAVGGLIGSSLFNLGILAVADLTHKARGYLFSRQSVESALSGVVSIAMTAVVGIGIFIGNQLGSHEFGGIGLFSILLLVTYVLGVRLIYHDQHQRTKPIADCETDERRSSRTTFLVHSLIGFAVCTAIIIVVSPWMAQAAGTIADESGMGNTFFGTTIIALATSLPELVACIAAVRMGAMNLAIGNVFGSNTFNMLLLIPLDVAYPGSLIGAVSLTHLLTCMFVVLITSAVIIGQLYRVESRKLLVEPDAAMILLLVAAGLVLVFLCR